MSVQKKSLISSRKPQTSVSAKADGNEAIGPTKTMKVAALRHQALKKSLKKAIKW
jgi:hypothetical protein